MKLAILGLWASAWILSGAYAADYHVAANVPGAADGNPGTAEQPWKTLQKAAATVQPGDTVFIHAGRYPESVYLRTAGTAAAPITFAAFEDDEVVLDGADPIPPDRWQRVEGFTQVFATPLEHDPGHIFVDGKPVYMKIDKVADDQWELGPLTDDDDLLWQFDRENKRLLFNAGGGNPAAGHRVEVPVRTTAFDLNTHCRLRGIHATRYAATAIEVGEDAVAEDCLVTDCVAGIRASGWDRRGAIIRRNTVIGCLSNGIFLQDRPTGCTVEDNLVLRCTLNPWHAVLWSGSVKMNSASDSVFAHNVVLEAGNPDTINGWDGWALWGDINIVRILYIGNTCAHNKEAGLYIEYAMGDTRAYFNTSYRNGHGITCRASQRGVFMYNYVQSCRSSGLAVWQAPEPYPTVDQVFAHNLVRDCDPLLRLQTEQPQFLDYNLYWPREGGGFADGENNARYATLEELQQATGHERHGEVRDVQPEAVGLGLVTFRVPDARDPDEVLMMVGNNGCELEDPAGINLLPYFWRPGTGDGQRRTFLYAAYTGLPGGVDTFGYSGGGGTVALRGDRGIAHSGARALEINGFQPERIPAEGLGFWSPTLPARPGDVINVSCWVRGQELASASAGAGLGPGRTAGPITAFVEFSSPTGQRRQRVDLLAGAELPAGTFDWQPITARVTVPETARRATFFFGLGPATGTVWWDDFSIQVQP